VQAGHARSYTDNGDGTITDNATGLMWEKKDQSGGIHDWSNTYTWCGASCNSTRFMDGTITTTFLAGLNAGAGFAGHTDWRVPNQNELATLVNYENVEPAVDAVFNTNCAPGCTVLTCSCTRIGPGANAFVAEGECWSSTTAAPFSPGIGGIIAAWFVDFGGLHYRSDIIMDNAPKGFFYDVRAVRDASTQAVCRPSQPLKTAQTTAFGTGSDGDLQAGNPRAYTDNGDGTITDNATGLTWEKKDQSGGIHDWANRYTWCGASCGSTNVMDGTITTTFLAGLNAGAGFAGHTDWRIPNVNELLTLVNYENAEPAVDAAFNTNCAPGCTVLTCSCTQPGFASSSVYWSSTTFANRPQEALIVDDGFVNGDQKDGTYFGTNTGGEFTRAVRGGL
jgi:hypothetical protein